MKNVIGLIHPDSVRHHRSKALCNNPNIVITEMHPILAKPGWYSGKFKVLKAVDIFRANSTQHYIHGFRPRHIPE